MHKTRVFLFLSLLGLLIAALPSPAAADEHRPGRHVIAGTVSATAEADLGTVLTIDVGELDDNPDDDHSVLVDANTHILPPGTEVAVGDSVKALVVVSGEQLLAVKLILARAEPPVREPGRVAVRVCGTIVSLPDDPAAGEWVIEDSLGNEHRFAVGLRTQITPRGATPAVGMEACAVVHLTAAGALAQQINLIQDRPERPFREHRLEIRGTVAGDVPEAPAGDWTLTLTVKGRNAAVEVTVTGDTQIEGELATGAEVVVRATRTVADDGTATLVAVSIKVLPGDRGRGHDRAARRIVGTVAAVSADGSVWTIATAEGDVDVAIVARTKIVGLAEGDDPVGMEVRGTVKLDSDGVLVAVLLRVGATGSPL